MIVELVAIGVAGFVLGLVVASVAHGVDRQLDAIAAEGTAKGQAIGDAILGVDRGRPETVAEHRNRSHPAYKKQLAIELADRKPYAN